MECARVWFLVALLPLLTGCFPTIYSEQPLGEPVVLDPEKWNGRWLGNNGEVSTWTVVDTDTVAFTVARDADSRLSSICNRSPSEMDRWSLRESQGWYIIYKRHTTRFDEIFIKDDLYITGPLIRLKTRSMYMSWINEQRVKALVEQGELPGRIEADRVILGALTQGHYKLLFQPREMKNSVEYPMAAKDDYPDFPDPIDAAVWIKLPDELDPCKKGDKGK